MHSPDTSALEATNDALEEMTGIERDLLLATMNGKSGDGQTRAVYERVIVARQGLQHMREELILSQCPPPPRKRISSNLEGMEPNNVPQSDPDRISF